MSKVAENPDWLQDFKTELDQQLIDSSKDRLGVLRQQAIDSLRTEQKPLRIMERWRYTPVDALFKQALNIEQVSPANDADYSELFTPGIDAYRFVVANGQAMFLGNTAELPDGVVLSTMQQAEIEHKELLSRYIGSALQHVGATNTIQSASSHKDSKLFQYLNQSVASDGVFIHMPENVKLDKPVEIVYLKSGNQADLVQTHSLVVVEANAELSLVEKHIGEMPSSSFCNNQLELVIGKQASMNHYYLQQQATGNWHRHGIDRIQDSGSNYQGWFGCCGSQWSRVEINAFFTGENATSEIQGIQLATNGQVNDVHVDIRHDKPNCHSEQHFRGLVSGKSKIVFDGNILVSKDAQKSVAHLSDKNLMLTRNSEVDAKPQLEIYADDVQCSHGTSIGELDEQQVFYLRSRGISEQQARNMLSIGFVAEMIDHIQLDGFKAMMLNVLEGQLVDTSSGEEGHAG
jgi:Fe-S cluster assembly protein SufD